MLLGVIPQILPIEITLIMSSQDSGELYCRGAPPPPLALTLEARFQNAPNFGSTVLRRSIPLLY